MQPPASSSASAVDDATLILPVRRSLGSLTAEVIDWQCSELGVGIGNPVSFGVYRFTGTARDYSVTIPWSLILKIAQSPGNLGLTDLGEGPDGSHWNYWRREWLLFESGLLQELPGGFTAPLYYGGSERPGNVTWLWLQDVSESPGEWSLDRYELAAYHLGCFNGAYLAGRQLPNEPWLSRNSARQFSRFAQISLTAVEAYLPDIGHHPVLRFVQESDHVLDRLEQLPQTFCHLDAGPYNLMSRTTGSGAHETVAIDWALSGIGPVGADLSQLAATLWNTQHADAHANDASLIDCYHTGLIDAGWRGERDHIMLGYAAYAVFRLTGFYLSFLQRDLENGLGTTLNDTSISALVPIVERIDTLVRRDS